MEGTGLPSRAVGPEALSSLSERCTDSGDPTPRSGTNLFSGLNTGMTAGAWRDGCLHTVGHGCSSAGPFVLCLDLHPSAVLKGSLSKTNMYGTQCQLQSKLRGSRLSSLCKPTAKPFLGGFSCGTLQRHHASTTQLLPWGRSC